MKNINGKRYRFEIEAGHAHFAIKAQCKTTGRYSFINNLNAIISAFNVNLNDFRFCESIWDVTSQETKKFKAIAKKLFTDRCFISYLEKKLDEDRIEGEWENISSI